MGAGEQPEGTGGVVVVLAWGWRVWGMQGAVPPLALGWPGERGRVGVWRMTPYGHGVHVPLPSLPAVPPRGGSDLPRAPAPCPGGGHGRGRPTRLAGSPLLPESPFTAAVELRLGGA